LRPGQLSGGECQRVAIARALANDPAVILADEPTAALDVANGLSVMQLLTDLVRRRGATLVVVTHDQRIFPFADRILHLTDGRLTRAWSPQSPPAPTIFKESVA
jgi:putative ABC transport system ATP-binding protein